MAPAMPQRAMAPRHRPAMQGTGIGNQARLRRMAEQREAHRLEREADAAAASLVAGGSAGISATPARAASGPSAPPCGAPLPLRHRHRLEAGLGIGLGGVRLHTNAAANSVTSEYAATALTFGQNIYFASGAYAPDQPSGARLLAHEVAHVGQQARGAPMVQRQRARPESEEERRARAIAASSEWFYETEAASPQVVALYAQKLQRGLKTPGVTVAEVIPAAEELLVLHDPLQARAGKADRDFEGQRCSTSTPWASPCHGRRHAPTRWMRSSRSARRMLLRGAASWKMRNPASRKSTPDRGAKKAASHRRPPRRRSRTASAPLPSPCRRRKA